MYLCIPSFVIPFIILFIHPFIIYCSIVMPSFHLFSHSLPIHLSFHMSFLITGSPIGPAPAAGPSGPKWTVSQCRMGVCSEAGKQGFGLLSEMRKLSADWVEVGRVRCSQGWQMVRGRGVCIVVGCEVWRRGLGRPLPSTSYIYKNHSEPDLPKQLQRPKRKKSMPETGAQRNNRTRPPQCVPQPPPQLPHLDRLQAPMSVIWTP